MAIELRIQRAATNNDTAGNGGRMSDTRSISGAVTNLFPRTTVAERTAGNWRLRKAFYKMHDPNDIDFFNVHIIPFMQTPALDYVTYFEGTQDDTQTVVETAGITTGYTHYGCGILNQSVTAGQQTLVVDAPVAGTTLPIFRNGDLIYVSDEDSWGGTGNGEYLNIDTVNYVGAVATINTVETFANSYSHTTTRVSSVYEYSGTLQGSVAEDSSSVAGSGAINYSDADFVVNHIGGTYQQWTLTWSSANNFTCVGDEIGSVGAGTVSGGISPNNPNYSAPYFTLPSSAFSGDFADGDTITFTTTPAAIPIWHYHVVPAGIASVVGNSFWAAFVGEGEE